MLLPDPTALLFKRSLTVEDVEKLVPYVHRYGYGNLTVIDLLVVRLFAACNTEAERRRVARVSNSLERNVSRR